MGKLEDYAANHRSRKVHQCSFCQLPKRAHDELTKMLDHNDRGEWSLTLDAALEWFKREHKYQYKKSALQNHVRGCLGRSWSKK